MLGTPSPPTPAAILTSPTPSQPFSSMHNVTSSTTTTTTTTKKKRRPAGTPDPDAEVVSLSPRTLLESDRYVCEICNQGFQRDQNLQMHRRRHKVPWKLLRRDAAGPGGEAARKRVFVCPEPSCLHHDPCHALGDLVGIKKHFRRKHSSHRQWVCARCSKAYAVQSDYKAHLKTCGTRGHSCDCGRVFSRVESFIEHQDTCSAGRARADQLQAPHSACLSRTGSSPSPSAGNTNFSRPATWAPAGLRMPNPSAVLLNSDRIPSPASEHCRARSGELQLLPPSINANSNSCLPTSDDAEARATALRLSIGPATDHRGPDHEEPAAAAARLREAAREQLKAAMADKALADEARQQAKRQIDLAEQEFVNAKRIRQQAQMDLNRAHALRDHAVKRINAMLLQVTCYACKKQFRAKPAIPSCEENSFVTSYMSSAVTEGEDENDDHSQKAKIPNT